MDENRVSGAIDALKELYLDAKTSKHRHFYAATRTRKWHIRLGLPTVIINVATGTILAGKEALDGAIPPWISVNAIAILFAFFAASLAAVQTFLNFQKTSEGHRSVGNSYNDIARKCKAAVRRHRDIACSPEEIWAQRDGLYKKYIETNVEAAKLYTSDADFAKARDNSPVSESPRVSRTLFGLRFTSSCYGSLAFKLAVVVSLSPVGGI